MARYRVQTASGRFYDVDLSEGEDVESVVAEIERSEAPVPSAGGGRGDSINPPMAGQPQPKFPRLSPSPAPAPIDYGQAATDMMGGSVPMARSVLDQPGPVPQTPGYDPMLNQGYVAEVRRDIIGKAAPEDRMGLLTTLAENRTDVLGRAARQILAEVQAENKRINLDQEGRAQRLLDAPRGPGNLPPPRPGAGVAPPPVPVPDVFPGISDVMEGRTAKQIAERRMLAQGVRAADEGMRMDEANRVVNLDRDRTVGEYLGDLGVRLEQGGIMARQVIANTIDPTSQWAAELAQKMKASQEAISAPEQYRAQQFASKLAQQPNEWAKGAVMLAEFVTNPTIAVEEVVRQGPLMGAMIAATVFGGGVGGLAVRGAAAVAPKVALADAISGGMVVSAGRAAGAVATARGAAAVAAGGDAAGQVYEELTSKKNAQLMRENADVKRLMDEGKTFEEARSEVALTKARLAQSIAATGGVIFGAAGFEGLLAKKIAGQAVGGAAKRAAVTEITTELADELTTTGAANFAIGQVDPNRALTQDFGQIAATTLVTTSPTAGASAYLASREQGVDPLTDAYARANLSTTNPSEEFISPTQTARSAMDVGPSAPARDDAGLIGSTINFTPPDSITAQAGLAPIVVPTAPAAAGGTDVGLPNVLGGLAGGSGVAGGSDPLAGLGGAGRDAAVPGTGGVNAAGALAGDGGAALLGAGATQPGPSLSAGRGERATDADLLARAEQAAGLTEASKPLTWAGRTKTGYANEQDAEQAMATASTVIDTRQTHDWRVEPMGNGRFQIVGYQKGDASGTAVTGAAGQGLAATASGSGAQQPGVAGAGMVDLGQGGGNPPGLPGGAATVGGAAANEPAFTLKLAPPAPLRSAGQAITMLKNARGVDVELHAGDLTDQQKVASAMARLVGKTVTYLDYVAGPADEMPNGFVIPGKDQNIYLDSKSSDGALFVMMHEGVHALPQPIREKLVTTIKGLTKTDMRADFAQKFQYDINNEAEIDNEIAAFMTQAVTKRQDFWQELRTKMGDGDFTEVAKVILDKLNTFIQGAQSAYGDDFIQRYATDAVAVRDAVSTAYADAMKAQGQQVPAAATTATAPGITASNRAADVNPLGMYSELARKIDAGPGQAMPDQWRGYIRGLTTKGVKPDEIEWSGVEDFLELKRAAGQKVTKAEVAEYLQQGGVRVEETVLSDEGTTDLPAGWRVREATEDDDAAYRYVLVDDNNEVRGEGATSAEAMADGWDPDSAAERPTKYGQYTLPGGENYREVLLTLPNTPGPESAEVKLNKANAFKQAMREKYGNGWLQKATPEELERNRMLSYASAEAPAAQYRSSHWDQPNVLAHIRVNDRTDADGKRVLFVEELQSDWGQEGKKKGFKGEPQFVAGMEGDPAGFIGANASGVPKAPFVTKTEGWLNLALKRLMVMAAEGGYDRVAFADAEPHFKRWGTERIDWAKQPDGSFLVRAKSQEGGDAAGMNLEAEAVARGLSKTNSNTVRSVKELENTIRPALTEGQNAADLAPKIWERMQAEGAGTAMPRREGFEAFYGDKSGMNPKTGAPSFLLGSLKKLLPKVGGGQVIAATIDVQGRPESGTGLQERREYQGPTLGVFEIRAVADDPNLPSAIQSQLNEVADLVRRGQSIESAMQQAGSISAAQALGGDMVALSEVPSQQSGFDITPAMREKVATSGLPMFSNKVKEDAPTEGKRVGSVDTHILAAVRGERSIAERTVVSAEEKTKVRASAAKLKLSASELETQVREHKAAHPVEDGWAPLVFNGVKKDDVTGKYVLQYKTIPYEFSNGSGGKSLQPETSAYTVQVDQLASKMLEEVRAVYKRAQAGDAAARKIIDQSGWYKEMRTRLRQEFGGLGDLFADLLGATSPNTPVRTNWDNSVEALRLLSNGKFDDMVPKWIEWSQKVNDLETQFRAWFNAKQEGGMSKAAIKKTDEYKVMAKELADARKLPDSLMPTKANGKKFGFNGGNVVRAIVDLWRVVKNADPDINRGGTAPKAINFSGNLIGFRARATIDVWAARMLQRLAGGARIPSMAEGGVSGQALEDGRNTLQFGFGQNVFGEAVKLIRNDAELSQDATLRSINDDDLQALVWFIEKEVWTKGNWTSAAGEGGSFELESDLAGIKDRDAVTDLRRIADSSVATTAEQRAQATADIARVRKEIESVPAIAQANAVLDRNAQRLVADKTAKPEDKLTGAQKKEIAAENAAARKAIDKARKTVAVKDLEKQISKAQRTLGKPTVEQSQASRAAAVGKLKQMSRTVDRFVGGLSIQQGDQQPTDTAMSDLANSIEKAVISVDDGATVIGLKAISTQGRYGSVERALDMEVIARAGFNARPMAAAVFTAARDANQDSAFVARVLRPDEKFDPLKHRPGIEIYFRDMKQAEEAAKMMAEIAGKRIAKTTEVGPGYFEVAGYTIIVDGRRTPTTRSGAMGTPVGMRIIYMPEFEARYGLDPRLADATENNIGDIIRERADNLGNFADEVLRKFDGVSFAGRFDYEVDTRFAGEYQGAIDAYSGAASTAGTDQSRSQAWQGRPVRESIAAAVGRVSVDGSQQGGELPGGNQISASNRAVGDGRGRADSAGPAPLPGVPVIEGATGPDPRIVAVAEQYARENGIDLKRQAEYVRVDPKRAARIAAVYEAMAHAPQDPKVKEAYDNLIRQTTAQYRALEAAGYKFWFIDPKNDPYKSPWDALRDLRSKQSMGVFSTADGFGSEESDSGFEGNLMEAETDMLWPYGSPDGELRPVLANDLFRAVHDAFGHGMEGAGFREQGEENAWQAHARLFTGSAVAAITSETRGQNSWLNYNPELLKDVVGQEKAEQLHPDNWRTITVGEHNRTAIVKDTVFADQKTGLMPKWTWTEGRVGDAVQASNRAAPEMAASEPAGPVSVIIGGRTMRVPNPAGAVEKLDAKINRYSELLKCLQ